MKTPKERDNLDLLILAFELHGRTLSQPNNKLMHDAYVEARQELESRLEVKTCNKPAVSNSVLAAIINLCETNIPYYAYGDNQAACEMAERLNEIGRLASTGC